MILLCGVVLGISWGGGGVSFFSWGGCRCTGLLFHFLLFFVMAVVVPLEVVVRVVIAVFAMASRTGSDDIGGGCGFFTWHAAA